MGYRDLGKTGLKVSEIGYGAWGIGNSGWLGAKDEESLKALHRAIELGLNFIDTARVYGDGHSERLVGQVVRERQETIYVSSKIPPKNKIWPALANVPSNEAFPAEHIIASTEESLRNLGLETIDVQQFHVWSDEWVDQGDWPEAIYQLKKQGKIRFFGVSINNHEPKNVIKLVESGLVDSVQVIYNIFDQSPEEELFPAAQQHGVGVIVRVPLDEGGLTGNITPNSTFVEGDFRNHYFRGDRKKEVFERVQQIEQDLGIAHDKISEVALQFALSHPAVSTVIPGMRSIKHVERNLRIGEANKLTTAQLDKLKKHQWNRNFYQA